MRGLGEIRRLAAIVCFMDEAEHLPLLLRSIAAQTLRPAQLLLVDDGSRDASGEIAAAFAREHSWARVLRRPPKLPSKDRLAAAGELVAFEWAAGQLEDPWDVILKLDGDLVLNSGLFEEVCRRFEERPQLGITGPHLSIRAPGGGLTREDNPPEHVRGATKFYRRECYEQISPIPAILGWDTIDEMRARREGWATESFEVRGGDCVHLRPSGQYDGRLRSLRRKGHCAWAYRAHPLWVLLGGVKRMRERPIVLGGASYVWGWVAAALSRQPRAERSLGALARRESVAKLSARLGAGPTGRAPRPTSGLPPASR